MEVNTLTKGYRSYNEDMVIVIKDHLFAVVDAATALCEPKHLPSDGVYLNKFLKEEILSLYHSHKLNSKNFTKRMNEISKRIYKLYIKGYKGDLERYHFPNASIAFVLIEGIDVHVFSIGDTSSFIIKKNGETRYISDKSIPLMDKKVVEHYHSIGVNQFEDMYEKLRFNRSLLNKGGKKATFSIYPKPNIKFKHEVFDIRELDKIYLCSDGYYQAFDTFRLYKSRRELFGPNVDLQDVYKGIVKAANEDKDMELYPRLKIIDDISAVKITF